MSEYKETVFLPRTTFSMRAGLPKKEPEILKFWQDIDTKNYWNKLVENLSLPSANLSIVDSDGLVNLLESK